MTTLFNKTVFFLNTISLFVVLFVLSEPNIYGQTFSEQVGSVFIPVSSAASASGDMDNDGDLDLVITGSSATDYISKIYRNNAGVFSDTINAKLAGVMQGSVALSDYNKDNYTDILLTGMTRYTLVTKLYRNNGGGSFSDIAVPIPGIRYGTAIWGDIDNDGDQDIFISGTSSAGKISKIYINNNDGTFNESFDNNITPLIYASADFGDFNNDHNIDLIISGLTGNSENEVITTLYKNDGKGVFSPVTNCGLPKLCQGGVKWGDYNNDGFIDLLIFGNETYSGLSKVTSVFKNNGNETFTKLNFSFTGVSYGSSAWGDLDNDGSLDVVLTGSINTSTGISKVFRYIGSDNFQEINVGWPGISFSSLAMADFNYDNKLDVFFSGNNSSTRVAKLFLNTTSTPNNPPPAPAGLAASLSGNLLTLSWSQVTGDITPSKGLTYNVRFGRSSGNGDIINPLAWSNGLRKVSSPGNAGHSNSLFINGISAGNYYWSVQAIDNSYSGGPFATQYSLSIDSVQASVLSASIIDKTTLKLKWKRGNGRRCIVFCKFGSGISPKPVHSITYIGDEAYGRGDQIGTTGWYCVYNGSSDSTVIKNLIQNKTYSVYVVEYLGNSGNERYFRASRTDNNGLFGTGFFTEQSDISLFGVETVNSAWADYNKDGYLDLLISGRSLDAGTNITRIYRNMGNGSFSILPEATLPGVFRGDAKWGDYDLDGFPDLILTGSITGIGNASKIYRNLGNGSFAQQSYSLAGNTDSNAAWGDFDNDGDPDLLISSYSIAPKLYRNDISGFTETGIPFTTLEPRHISWADFDGNGYSDIFIAGIISTSPNYSNKIYYNNGNNTFTGKDITLLDEGLTSAIIADYDKDGDNDIIANANDTTIFLLNNGNGIFNKSSFILTETSGKSEICDINNDGFPDLILSGSSFLNSKLFINNGPPFYYFTEQTGAFSIGSGNGSVCAGDYNNDGNLDIVITGRNNSSVYSKVYRNNANIRTGSFSANKKPLAPASPKSTINPNQVVLNWTPVTGDETPAITMGYNLRYKKTSETYWKAAPLSTNTGQRVLPVRGNIYLNNSFTLNDLQEGTYIWNVQAVDQSYQGGYWSSDATFQVRRVQTFFSADEVCHGYPTHFSDESVGTISSWKWDFRDGTSSTLKNPVHTYVQSGIYNVKLVITDIGGMKDSLVKTVIVKPKPLTSFTAPSVCMGMPVIITNNTNNNGLLINSWKWDFGDENTSSLQQPAPHPYLIAADYTIKLKAVASNGCADSVSHVVSVGSYPVAAVTANAPLIFCNGDSVKLTVPLVPEYNYNWKLSGTNIAGGTKNQFTARNSGNYSVEIVNPKGGCISNSLPVEIVVKEAPVAPLILSDGQHTLCQDDSIKLSVSAASGNKYYWKLNGGAIGTDLNTYYAKASGEYSLTLSNSSGCSAVSVNKITVNVNPRPVVSSVSLSGSTEFCSGESLLMSVTPTTGYSYQWSNASGPITGASSNSYSASGSGQYRLRVTNQSGCYISSPPITVLVKEMPSLPVIVTENYQAGKCNSDGTITLRVDQAVQDYSYRWKRNGTIMDNSSSSSISGYIPQGDYTVEANNNGCISESAPKNIVYADAPEKPKLFVQGPVVWYMAASNDKAAKYRWYRNDQLIQGADRFIYLANKTLGTYKVAVGNIAGCFTMSDPVTIPVSKSEMTSFKIPSQLKTVENIDPFENIKIYPNPTPGLFTIEMDNSLIGELNIDILSQEGRKILNIKFEKTTDHFKSEVDLSGQAKGMYIINLLLNNFAATRKVMVR